MASGSRSGSPRASLASRRRARSGAPPRRALLFCGRSLRDARRRRSRRAIKNTVDAGALALEIVEDRSIQLAAARKFDAHRIDEAAVDQHLVMQMRAGRQPGRADIADHLTLANLDAGLDAARE